MKRSVWAVSGAVACIVIVGGVYITLRHGTLSKAVAASATFPLSGSTSKTEAAGNTKSVVQSVPKQGDTFHFYSPLQDPPPSPSFQQQGQWWGQFKATLLRDIQPDMAGPPYVSSYHRLAKQANSGNLVAARALFTGLRYCQQTTWAILNTDSQVSSLTAAMIATNTNRYGMHVSDVGQAVSYVRQQYDYCKGTHALAGELQHWAMLTIQGHDPAVLARAWEYVPPILAGGQAPLWAEQIKVESAAAQVGVPYAWMELATPVLDRGDAEMGYSNLDVAYLLTRSKYLEWELWKRSQGLEPWQIADAEARARNIYRDIGKTP